ncbi:coadhesin-like [Orbicella faveolata]|uniref:coadhesin-like n=1 Tax=Orbicella faveolata TaxID=48498 RepID=UPI0009E39337|nr:coadhesin-like [Orbicella faveolata]
MEEKPVRDWGALMKLSHAARENARSMVTTLNGRSGLTAVSHVEEESRNVQELAPIHIQNTAERIATSWERLTRLTTDGNYTEWTTWSDCDVTCGGGVQSRSRKCTNPAPQHGGKSCEDLGPANQTLKCNTSPCPIDGNYTEWSKWSDCSVTCGGGKQKRSRNCTNPPPKHGGKNCDDLGPDSESLECNPDPCHFAAIDGNYTEWSKWSDCDVTCGGGVQSRSRKCINPAPQYRGKSCEDLGPANQTLECNKSPCPIDGNYTEWSKWSDCSVTCGGGKRKRSRTCTNPHPKHGGKNCDDLGPASESLECNPDPCPIDGNYTEWSAWSECNVTCDGGLQTRTRQCTNPPPQYGGKDCEELGPTNATQECNTHPCPPPCSAGLDIGIVLDKSRSVNIRNLKKIIASLAELVDRFEPGPDKDHFGLVTFNRRAYTEFTFSDETLYRKETLKKKISEIPLTLALQTRTDLAMKEARDNLFSPSGGDRPEKPNIMIFLTDGRPTNQPRDFATFAAEFYKDSKVAGLYTVAVGIGNQIKRETLKDIAGENGSVIAIESFDQLANELSEIKDKVCD